MSEIPQNSKPAEEKTRHIQQAAAIGKYTLSVMKSILFIAPLVLVLIVVGLSLLSHAVGNIFSNVVGSL